MAKDEKDACYQLLSFGLWWTFVVHKTRLLLAKKFILELFWRAKYSTIKRRVACWRNIVLEEYVEVKEKNIEIFEEINEGLVIEEPEIKEEIIEEVVNDLDEVKLDDCNVQAPIILVGATKTKFIDFIGVERSNLIIDSYLVNIVNCMKIKGQEVQVAQLMTFKFGKKTRKMEYSKYLFI